MKGFLEFIGFKPVQDDLLDLVVRLGETVDSNLLHLKSLGGNKYSVEEAVVEITWFDEDAFEEVRISYGYTVNKGVTVVIRNYAEHLVVMNHEVQDTIYVLTKSVPTESLGYAIYRRKLDAQGLNLVNAIKALNTSDNSA